MNDTDQPEAPAPTSIHAEISAMGTAYDALAKLDVQACFRALHWLEERLHYDHHSQERAAI